MSDLTSLTGTSAPRNYRVVISRDRHETVTALEATIGTAGNLSFWGVDTGGKPVLLKAFAMNAWTELTLL